MPIYEYHCTVCRNHFELLRAFGSADDEAPCPDCAAPAHRGISVFATGRAAGDDGAAARSTGGRCGSCSGGSCATCR